MARFIKAPNADAVVADAITPQLERRAGRIVESARSRIPPRTGDMARSLKVTTDDRGVVAESTSSFFHLIESGSINNTPPIAPLRSAAADAGRFEPK